MGDRDGVDAKFPAGQVRFGQYRVLRRGLDQIEGQPELLLVADTPGGEPAAAAQRLEHDRETHFVREALGVVVARYHLVARRPGSGLFEDAFQV